MAKFRLVDINCGCVVHHHNVECAIDIVFVCCGIVSENVLLVICANCVISLMIIQRQSLMNYLHSNYCFYCYHCLSSRHAIRKTCDSSLVQQVTVFGCHWIVPLWIIGVMASISDRRSTTKPVLTENKQTNNKQTNCQDNNLIMIFVAVEGKIRLFTLI